MEKQQIYESLMAINKELTIDFLHKKLMALEEAFEPFHNDCGFYVVNISLQGHFNSIITKVASKMGYVTTLEDNGFVSLKKGKITITLT
jgi:hypothetical protein